jgi:zinc protease
MVALKWNDLLFVNRRFNGWEDKLDKAIKGVTRESANAALRKYIDPAKLTIAIAADPEKKR